MSALVEATRKAWGEQISAWQLLLAEMCDKTSQAKIATKLGYSASVISMVLKNKYPGDLKAVETAVQGAFLDVTVECPVLGEIGAHKCISKQRARLVATSNTNIRLWRACRGEEGRKPCQHFKGKAE
jgi:hypothetical protein